MFSGAWKRGRTISQGEHELFEYVGEFIPFIQQETQEEEAELPQTGAAAPNLEELQEEPDTEEYGLIENRLFLAMEEADVYLDDFHRSRWMLSMKLLKKV